jgi:hypothetical protein
MEKDSGMTLKGKTAELGEISAPVPLCPPQIPHTSKVTFKGHVPKQRVSAVLLLRQSK